MTGWHQGVAFAFDTETTAVDFRTARIVTASIVKFVDGQQVGARSWMINPGVPISEDASKVNGLTDEIVQELGVEPGPAIAEIGQTIAQVLKSRTPLFAFNAVFDLSFLEAELARYNRPTLTEQLMPELWHHLVDPLVLARGIDKNLPPKSFKDPATGKGWVYKLPNLCERYGVPFTETHEASADAAGCLALGLALAKKRPEVAEKSPSALFNIQQTWHRSNQSSLRDYWQRTGDERASTVDTGWPLHTDLMRAPAVSR